MPDTASRRTDIPVPDPTQRTIEQLQREIGGAKEQILATVSGLREVFDTRLVAMDRAIVLIQKSTDLLPGIISDSVHHLQEVQDEKFSSIETQFAEKDKRLEQTTASGAIAIAAALQAQKEAVGQQNESNSLAIAKSEAGFTKQIDQIAILIGAGQKNTDDKFDDIKSRMGVATWALAAAFLALVISVGALIISVMPRVR